MEKYLNEFIEKLKEEGKSENTIKSYTLHMQEYFKWFEWFEELDFCGRLHRQQRGSGEDFY